MITAVTGIRRAGKSVLLRQLAASLRSERQVVYIDKESFDFEPVRTARDLVDLVESTTRRDEPRVVIVDEVQQIQDWERAVASLNGQEHTQVVISGSNATLLSAELATLIAGRYVTLQVFPLTLREFGDLYRQRTGGSLDDAALFRLYLRIGGLPGLLHTDLSDPVVDQMLADIVNTIAIRDVIRRHRIRDVAEREELTETGLGSTARCRGRRRHRQANSVRVCLPTSRRVASLRPRSAGRTALTPAPRTLVQTGSCRRCSLIHPLHVVVDVPSRMTLFRATADTATSRCSKR